MATIKDVAKLAGVSYQAVSAVLNGNLSKAAPLTRERIFLAAAKLNYRPNRSARSLVSGRSGMVGIVIQDIRSPYFADLTWELQSAADRAGFQTIQMQSDWTDARTCESIFQLYSTPVDGIIFIGGVPHKMMEQTKIPADYPLIQIDDAENGYNSIGFDYLPGMDEAFRDLLEHGHRRIAFVHDPIQQIKYAAYRECCRKHSVPFREFRYLSPTAGGEDAVISCGHAVAAAAKELDAIIVASDYDALLVLRALADRNIRIPQDLSMIAIDDTLLSRIGTPPLSSIHLDRRLLAQKAFERLLARIAKRPDPDGHQMISTALVRRASVIPHVPGPENHPEAPLNQAIGPSAGHVSIFSEYANVRKGD